MAATVHGMQVTVDRDSVCMGDDCEDHARTLEVPPDTRVGALLTDLLSRPFLAHVAGEVSWLVELRFGRDEVVGAEWRRAPRVAVALLHVPYPSGAPTVVALNDFLLRETLGRTSEVHRAPVAVHFGYLSAGQQVPVDAFAARYRPAS